MPSKNTGKILGKYDEKRNFKSTTEPGPVKKSGKGGLKFVVQKHQASHLHYDFRLENRGVLLSWAVPKGPSLNPDDKRLAMAVEDHPFDYRTFEGVIPEGNYGAGTVMVWDEGTYAAVIGPNGEEAARAESEKLIAAGMHKGHITFNLHGKKLKGEFALIKIKGDKSSKDNGWLLVKADDEYASKKDVAELDRSAVTNKSLEEISGKKKFTPKVVGEKNKLPKDVQPMLATLVDESFDSSDWIFEIKYDGYRAIAEIDKKISLYSRNNLSFNKLFAPIIESLGKLKMQAVLDGEVVVLNDKGISEFQLLQNYQKTGKGKLIYYVFDILYLNGHDLRGLPLISRKEILKEVLAQLNSKDIRYSDDVVGTGKKLFQAAAERGLEGIIAKKADSTYVGKRSDNWQKIKTHFRQEAVIGGFTEPKGSRKNIGALILGVYENGKLKYIGHTGGGMNQKQLQDLHKDLEKITISKSPFEEKFKTNAPATWVEPKLVCEVSFQGWTDSGHMRQPILEGIRIDKKAEMVKPEKPQKNQEEKAKVKSSNTKPKGKTESKSRDYQIKIDGKELKLSHLDKIYWPREKYTKGDLIEYYTKISDYILPYLKDRPESLNRHPNGINGPSFFQKDVDHQFPDWIETKAIFSESNNKDINYMLCQNKATLIFMANLGCIEINPWSSRKQKLDYPDFLVIDLDPEKISFDAVIKTAQEVKKLFDRLGIKSYCKTSGATGLHIFVPTGAKYDYDQVKDFAHLIALNVNKKLPDITSVERLPKKRQGKVYLDFLQNRKGQTLAAPYSARPKEAASVSTPLKWSEVKKGLDPKKFTIKTIFKRLEKEGDLWKPVLKGRFDMAKALKKF